MRKGTQVKLSETSLYYKEDDRHNPKDQTGEVVEYLTKYRIIVKWWCNVIKGHFTNSYELKDLVVV